MTPERMRDLSLARIGAVADALPSTLREQVVFIGGIVLPLLVDVQSRFDTPRVTKDVDAVMMAVSYTRFAETEDTLRHAGFRHAPEAPISRWVAPNGEVFDLTSAGTHAGGTGAAVDIAAFNTANRLPERSDIRVLSGLGFLLMKAAAFRDRGVRAPAASRDLSDVAVLLVGRASLLEECRVATAAHQALVRESAAMLLDVPGLIGALRAHFNDREPIPPDTPDSLAVLAIETLKQLANIA